MLDRHTVVAAYNATEEAADGLALARLLGGLTDSDVLIVRVLQDMVDKAVNDRSTQADVRETVQQTRRALVAALPHADDEQIMPVLDPKLARGLHEAASSNDAAFLVVGSTHHSSIGRILLGGSAELVVDHSPCPVAVAPPGFRDAPRIDPGIVGCAYDGSPESREALRTAVELARAAGLPLRLISVGPNADALLDRGEAEVAELDAGVTVGRLELGGSPAGSLVAETDGVGILVVGSRSLGPVRKAVLGSVSRELVRHARCPVLVTPRRG